MHTSYSLGTWKPRGRDPLRINIIESTSRSDLHYAGKSPQPRRYTTVQGQKPKPSDFSTSDQGRLANVSSHPDSQPGEKRDLGHRARDTRPV